MDLETEYKHNLLTVLLLHWNTCTCSFFMPAKELREAYSPSVLLCVQCISSIFFKAGIPNLVCGCILGWRSVAYYFRVTVTLNLTSDLVLRKFVSGAYLLYYLR